MRLGLAHCRFRRAEKHEKREAFVSAAFRWQRGVVYVQ